MLDSKDKKYRENFKYVAHKGAAGMNTASTFVQLFLVTTIAWDYTEHLKDILSTSSVL